MKKILLVILAVSLMTSSCAMFGTLFSENSKNFDEKVNKVRDYLKTQNCTLQEYAGSEASDRNYYDYGNEQLIIVCTDDKDKYADKPAAALGSMHALTLRNYVIMGGNIMSNKLHKGALYLSLEVALSKEDNAKFHRFDRGQTIREFTLEYDGKSIPLKDKSDYDTYLYGNQQLIYSDIKILKDIANAKEIVIEGRSAAGIKYSKKLTGNDLTFFKRMLNIVENVNKILTSKM